MVGVCCLQIPGIPHAASYLSPWAAHALAAVLIADFFGNRQELGLQESGHQQNFPLHVGEAVCQRAPAFESCRKAGLNRCEDHDFWFSHISSAFVGSLRAGMFPTAPLWAEPTFVLALNLVLNPERQSSVHGMSTSSSHPALGTSADGVWDISRGGTLTTLLCSLFWA